MIKRLLNLLWVIFVVLSLPLLIVHAEREMINQDGLAFVLNSDGESYYVYGFGVRGDLVIPSEVNNKLVTKIDSKGFQFYPITSLTIPDSVTSIGDYAFEGCEKITSLTIPGTVVSIGEDAFHACNGLTNVIIENGVKNIGNYAFRGCRGLISISIPDSITVINDRVFETCTSLESITIPNSVTSIGARAFENCTSLKSITIPDGVTSIGDRAFENCDNLTIRCSKNSEAYKTAQKCGIPVEYLCNGHIWIETDTVGATCKDPGSISYSCKNCDETKQDPIAKLTEHRYDNNCDEQCNICDEKRTIQHSYSTQWSKDNANHWHSCTTCNIIVDRGLHTWDKGMAEKEEIVYTCTVCGANKIEKIKNIETTEPEQTESNETEPTETEPNETLPTESTPENTVPKESESSKTETESPISNDADERKQDQVKGKGIIWIILAVVVLGGGIVVLIIRKNKA